MPYLTPFEVPDVEQCRALLIPESSEWLAIFSGALTELTMKYNWQEQGITVDEALAVVNTVLEGYYAGCVESGCQQPDGGGIFRINPETWAIEQLVNGEWVTPEGEYLIPPTPAREESTPEERRCLAAANAVNALGIIYEEQADAFAATLTAAEAQFLMITTLVGLIGLVFGVIVAPLLGLLAALFGVFYLVFNHLTADMWDTEFEEKLYCFFYECSYDVGGVVTFDLTCIQGKILGASILDWSAQELQLLLQLGTLFQFLGAQAVDAMGATTAVTEADCDTCDNTWCYVAYLTETDAGFIPQVLSGTAGAWTSLSGWNASNVTAWAGYDRTLLMLSLAFDTPVQLDTIDVHYTFFNQTYSGDTEGVGLYANAFANSLWSQNQNVTTEGYDLTINVDDGVIPQPADGIDLWFQPAIGEFGGTARLVVVQLTGHEDKPTFLEALGWVECPPP